LGRVADASILGECNAHSRGVLSADIRAAAVLTLASRLLCGSNRWCAEHWPFCVLVELDVREHMGLLLRLLSVLVQTSRRDDRVAGSSSTACRDAAAGSADRAA
jgi:hypothetical protein